jgi:hypothetical protein
VYAAKILPPKLVQWLKLPRLEEIVLEISAWLLPNLLFHLKSSSILPQYVSTSNGEAHRLPSSFVEEAFLKRPHRTNVETQQAREARKTMVLLDLLE